MKEERYYTIDEVREILGYKTNYSVVKLFSDLFYTDDSVLQFGRGEYLILKESVLAYQEEIIDKDLCFIAGGGYNNEFHRSYAFLHRFNRLFANKQDSSTVTYKNLNFTIILVRKYNTVIDFIIEVKNKDNQTLVKTEIKLKKLLIEVLAKNLNKKNRERLKKGLQQANFNLNSFSDCLVNLHSNFNGAINFFGETYAFDNLDSLKQLVTDIENKEKIVRVSVYNENWNLTRYKVKHPESFKIEDIKYSSLRKGLYHVETYTNSGVEKYYRIEK